ncbi:MAG: hypothetical protein ACE5OS_13225 [Anaerolineae bacterium]
MERRQEHYHSHLFTVRLWLEDLGDGQAEWRGRVQHVLTSEVRYFREWPALIDHLLAMLPAVGSEGGLEDEMKGTAHGVEVTPQMAEQE